MVDYIIVINCILSIRSKYVQGRWGDKLATGYPPGALWKLRRFPPLIPMVPSCKEERRQDLADGPV